MFKKMIIAFAFGVIGAVLILANYKSFRKPSISIIAFVFAAAIAALGIYFIKHVSKETDSHEFFPMFTPLSALVFMLITRLVYKKYRKTEIILYLRSLFPLRQEERYVTKQEIRITFILLLLSVLIPYLVLVLVL